MHTSQLHKPRIIRVRTDSGENLKPNSRFNRCTSFHKPEGSSLASDTLITTSFTCFKTYSVVDEHAGTKTSIAAHRRRNVVSRVSENGTTSAGDGEAMEIIIAPVRH